jgi:hypothetical protein
MEVTEPTASPAIGARTDPKGKANAQRLTPISVTERGRDGERYARAAASGGVSIDRSMAAAARSDQAGDTKHDTGRPRLMTTTEVRGAQDGCFRRGGPCLPSWSLTTAATAGQAAIPCPMSPPLVRWGCERLIMPTAAKTRPGRSGLPQI